MRNEQIAAELERLIGEYLCAQGLELIELIYRFEGKGMILRLFVDKPGGGISLGECACLNRGIGDMLEEKQIMDSQYMLEVSSPGLDRPLRSHKDFSRSVSKTVKCFLKEPINGKIEWDGMIMAVSGTLVSLQTKQGTLELPFEKINMAKPIII